MTCSRQSGKISAIAHMCIAGQKVVTNSPWSYKCQPGNLGLVPLPIIYVVSIRYNTATHTSQSNHHHDFLPSFKSCVVSIEDVATGETNIRRLVIGQTAGRYRWMDCLVKRKIMILRMIQRLYSCGSEQPVNAVLMTLSTPTCV
ncbi:uncharacterized protein [Argopecten irradians]|uniref:uncharacterized protein n=1 Tax=Argopecten irradians TaxID=31199 RepID=UPI00371BAEF2